LQSAGAGLEQTIGGRRLTRLDAWALPELPINEPRKY
jgi:hypothetical protein